jgi:hypothetical protein
MIRTRPFLPRVRKNEQEQGVSHLEAESAFYDSRLRVFEDDLLARRAFAARDHAPRPRAEAAR